MTVTLDAQRSTLNARRAMPVSHHRVWCDRASCVDAGVIPSRFSLWRAYARHTPHATPPTHIDNLQGGVSGWLPVWIFFDGRRWQFEDRQGQVIDADLLGLPARQA